MPKAPTKKKIAYVVLKLTQMVGKSLFFVKNDEKAKKGGGAGAGGYLLTKLPF